MTYVTFNTAVYSRAFSVIGAASPVLAVGADAHIDMHTGSHLLSSAAYLSFSPKSPCALAWVPP
jgi:hypothetical protein